AELRIKLAGPVVFESQVAVEKTETVNLASVRSLLHKVHHKLVRLIPRHDRRVIAALDVNSLQDAQGVRPRHSVDAERDQEVVRYPDCSNCGLRPRQRASVADV